MLDRSWGLFSLCYTRQMTRKYLMAVLAYLSPKFQSSLDESDERKCIANISAP
jgi:hypothetical protein